jgi:hypothetical protein
MGEAKGEVWTAAVRERGDARAAGDERSGLDSLCS